MRAVLENDKSTTADINYASQTLKLLGQAIPNPVKVAQVIQAKLKEDDSLQSLGHALHAAALLGDAGKFMNSRIEDVVVQADEIDGRMLQWEGGLSTTSLLLTGLLKTPGAKPLTQAQADKFATYLLNRRSVQNPKGVVALLEALNALSSSNVSPVSITLVGPPYIKTDKPDLQLRISDLLGNALKPVPSPVIAQSATRVTDDVVVLSKQTLTPGTNPTDFSLPLRLEPGQYKIALSAGSHSSSVSVRVLGPVTLKTFEIGLGDADGSAAARLTKLQYPNKLSTTLQADSSQHLIVKFSLDHSVHQSFLKLSSGKREIIFVAEKDNSQMYKIEVNLAQELSHSGIFDVELILGDSVMSNSLLWNVGKLEVKLGTSEPPSTVTRGAKPEIHHLFRPAEKRPPHVVSMFFTFLVAAPLLLLLLMWIKIGINFSNFTITALPFHLGLASILGLFTMFWIKLDMFTTCGWLIPLGAFTFLAGNRLLSRIAKQKKH